MAQPEYTNSLFHGYTYSAHTVAVAAGLATIDVFHDEGVGQKVREEKEKLFEELFHSLKGEPNVIDIRNVGFAGSVEFASIPDQPGIRGHRITEALYEAGFYLRWSKIKQSSLRHLTQHLRNLKLSWKHCALAFARTLNDAPACSSPFVSPCTICRLKTKPRVFDLTAASASASAKSTCMAQANTPERIAGI
ncbi:MULTISPECIES: aminotransferase class III-fold pyridoxal phosphate-dependent enzyme [unclassified Pseudomonas]|uniref:aminotransferase class III-fold pyridoxal phosphate-dependent enzyme n=1 Tax=unclassified Pseudomonas TaxID=196821 RepID=UPI00211568EA|nr:MULTISPECIES: aminotransferase class III-fold pyridoxal phosphate-dependent enzyme [unclassified Pseudomonas]